MLTTLQGAFQRLKGEGESTWSGWEWPATKQADGVQSQGQQLTQVQGARLPMVNTSLAKITDLEAEGSSVSPRGRAPADSLI